MIQRQSLKSGKKLLQFIRRISFGNDPSKTFRDKGLSEENRYFFKKQADDIKKLRKQLQLLAKYQEKLESKLNQTQKAIDDLGNSINEKK